MPHGMLRSGAERMYVGLFSVTLLCLLQQVLHYLTLNLDDCTVLMLQRNRYALRYRGECLEVCSAHSAEALRTILVEIDYPLLAEIYGARSLRVCLAERCCRSLASRSIVCSMERAVRRIAEHAEQVRETWLAVVLHDKHIVLRSTLQEERIDAVESWIVVWLCRSEAFEVLC